MVYPIAKLIILSIYKLWLRKVEGLDNIPKDEPFIVALNHSSFFDIFLLPCIIVPKLNKRMHSLVNSYYWNGMFTKFFLDLWQCIPVYVEKEPNAKEKNKLALERALNYIKQGHILMIFPEGRRSDGKLLKGRTGIARLALKAKVPVLPCGIIGANKVMPKGKIFPRFTRCEVRIGKVMYFDEYYKKRTNEIYEEVTRKIMKQIAKLIGQEYMY
ncbi:1-acyl-sn-glycerol-3-phosphate acyltransferase [Candidatus Woesearchaeota archaeon]|nr:1-acyl-sn-glycerol-3-phosphate acyltransferase [Candidatus Woesearchaeota archaeon]